MKDESTKVTREIIFQMDDPNYRVVCRYGYDWLLDTVWWAHIEKRNQRKKYILFGESIDSWHEIGKCWWGKRIKSMEDLKKNAISFYESKIILPKEIAKEARDLK